MSIRGRGVRFGVICGVFWVAACGAFEPLAPPGAGAAQKHLVAGSQDAAGNTAKDTEKDSAIEVAKKSLLPLCSDSSAQHKKCLEAMRQIDTTVLQALDTYKSSMVTEWRVSRRSWAVALPLRSAAYLRKVNIQDAYDFYVDWGDGSAIEHVTENGAGAGHTYSRAGTYEVRLRGVLKAWGGRRGLVWENSTSNDKLVKVKSLGDMQWRDLSFAFFNAQNLRQVQVPEAQYTKNVRFIDYAFYGTFESLLPDWSEWSFKSVKSATYFWNTEQPAGALLEVKRRLHYDAYVKRFHKTQPGARYPAQSCGFKVKRAWRPLAWPKSAFPLDFILDRDMGNFARLDLAYLAEAWNAALGMEVIRVLKTNPNGLDAIAIDGKNFIKVLSDSDEGARFAPGVLASTYVGSGGRCLGGGPLCDAVFNVTDMDIGFKLYGEKGRANFQFGAVPSRDKFHFRTVMLHELGHALGLVHSDSRSSIMYPSVPRGVVKEVHASDAQAFHCMYSGENLELSMLRTHLGGLVDSVSSEDARLPDHKSKGGWHVSPDGVATCGH